MDLRLVGWYRKWEVIGTVVGLGVVRHLLP